MYLNLSDATDLNNGEVLDGYLRRDTHGNVFISWFASGTRLACGHGRAISAPPGT